MRRKLDQEEVKRDIVLQQILLYTSALPNDELEEIRKKVVVMWEKRRAELIKQVRDTLDTGGAITISRK